MRRAWAAFRSTDSRLLARAGFAKQLRRIWRCANADRSDWRLRHRPAPIREPAEPLPLTVTANVPRVVDAAEFADTFECWAANRGRSFVSIAA
jgi:hypothetical protein